MVNSVTPRPNTTPVGSDQAASPLSTPSRNGPQQGRGATAAGTHGTDQVQLSISGTISKMASAPPVDRARVEHLGEEIASGRYAVVPERIADALIRDALDILG